MTGTATPTSIATAPATQTPTPAATATSTPPPAPTATATDVLPSETPTSLPTETATSLPAATATASAEPTATAPEISNSAQGLGVMAKIVPDSVDSHAPTLPSSPSPSAPVTITYTYDPLNRLTAADYDSGEFFYYTYDAVGNRLTQDTLAGTNIYAYDIANRLTSVDGVTYTWDANGNMLSDGVNTYTYDAANRLSSVSGPQSVSTFAYNGLGDRLQQTVDGVPTNYTLDINVGLTQILADGMNAYLYGVGRIGEQQSGGWVYHHGDALGSVRQLTDLTGAVTLAQNFSPYGEVLNSGGDVVSNYGFTGEFTDTTGMIHLRARHLNAGVGRFISRDTWGGNFYRPLSINRWGYVEGNPINLTDPSRRTVGFSCNWPTTNIPAFLDGKFWRIDNDLCEALDDPSASLKLLEDFYRQVVANALVLNGAPDAAILLRRSLDGKISPFQVSKRLGNQLMDLPSHQEELKLQEQLMLFELETIASKMECGTSQSFYYGSPALLIVAYRKGETTNVKFSMADHTGWFTWQGEIVRNKNGNWKITGTLDRDLADYSDWHGDPHDYDGDGTLECPDGYCGKLASFDLASLPGFMLKSGQTNTKITIPDDWMARLVAGGEASYPGFGIYYNTREEFGFTIDNWSNWPVLEYENLKRGNRFREPKHEIEPGYWLP